MKTQFVAIRDEATWLEKRGGYVTSTESASLFGLQMPSLPTAYELWHIKRGLIDRVTEVNSRMIWGRRLEASIAAGIAEDNQLKLMPMRSFAFDDEDKIGSSFDNIIEHPERGHGLLEIKTVSYKNYKEKFVEDSETGFIEAPAYYEVQVQHELEVADKYNFALLAVFIMDTREVALLYRDRDRDFGAAIRKKVKEFWASTQPPPPDLQKDADLLARMHRANSKDKSYDATRDDMFELSAMSYIQESEKEKAAKAAKDVAKSRMILAMTDHNTAWCNSARVSNKATFRVTPTKEKNNA